jgi:hypothetical protein
MPLQMINWFSQSTGRLLGGLVVVSLVTCPASAQWAIVNLHPNDPGITGSFLNGGRDGQQVGYATLVNTAAVPNARVWNGTAASWVDLHPPGAARSIALRVSNGKQVGYAYFGNIPRAILWSGSAASWIDLTPPGSGSSFGLGISGTQQVGQAARGANVHAGFWTGTADSWVDLHPANCTDSTAWDTDGTQQVGYAYPTNSGGNSRASVWTGTANSWVNLHPSAAFISRALAVHDGQQVGWGSYPLAQRAHLWTDTANSLVDLHPAGAFQSWANGVHAGQQVGTVILATGANHAALWSGTAASWVDLHTFLPPGFTVSEANDIWHSGPYTYVVGFAYNTATMRYEAIMWKNGPSCPADINNDGSVNIDDLLAVISGWGFCPPPPAACSPDINHNGQIDIDDLLAVISGWGNC